MAAVRRNPAWTNRALEVNWTALEPIVGAAYMPICPAHRCKEYGSGYYGTVMPTGTPGVVCKITWDADEAKFVAIARRLKRLPAGIVRYHAVIELPREGDSKRVFAIWREEAYEIGDVAAFGFKRWWRGELAGRRAFVAQLEDFRNAASELRDSQPAAHRRHGKRRAASPASIARALERCRRAAAAMRKGAFSRQVGEALAFYLDKGVVLADVHDGNVGIVRRGSQAYYAVTDPGEAVVMNAKLRATPVPRLPAAAPSTAPARSNAARPARRAR